MTENTTDTTTAVPAPEATARRAVHWAVRDTPIGPLLLAATEQGLVSVVFRADEPTAGAAAERLGGLLGGHPIPLDASSGGDEAAAGRAAATYLADAIRELDAYFAGTLREFTVDLDWSLIAGFNRRVLRELATGVPYGTVVGYQTLADRVGEPGAARAVGVAMGSNPLPVVVPCHRVVESDGGIGGFGGGLEIKRALLALEGVLPEPLF